VNYFEINHSQGTPARKVPIRLTVAGTGLGRIETSGWRRRVFVRSAASVHILPISPGSTEAARRCKR